ncbi:hypothetical protein OG369_10070 [Streptomyces sp. NBC_01221]|uniref:hypothetical protein n=1 Tax=Streptomyces sp. NBC_01221 TaxID=2903782 RepID=UPI0022554D0D|nr:hypothetical protein [Streptomyces sp. NBC_01221]MCX4786518.1 hypothetical protein [Streptomyces sp. NBC_01221]
MTAADLARLDVPLANLVAAADQLTALKTERLAAGLAAEYRHLTDTRDAAFAVLACTHPEACSCDADYPNWTPGGTR